MTIRFHRRIPPEGIDGPVNIGRLPKRHTDVEIDDDVWDKRLGLLDELGDMPNRVDLGSRVGRQFRGPAVAHVISQPLHDVDNLGAVGRDDKAIDPGALLRALERVLNEGFAVQRSDVLAPQAFGSTPCADRG